MRNSYRGRSAGVVELAERIGRRIRAFRRERGWSPEALAISLRCPTDHVAAYEEGRWLAPTYTLRRLADLFGVSIAALVDEEPTEWPLAENRLIAQFRRIQLLPMKDRAAIAEMLAHLLDFWERIRRPKG